MAVVIKTETSISEDDGEQSPHLWALDTPENSSRHTLNGDGVKLEIKLEGDKINPKPDEQETTARETSQEYEKEMDQQPRAQDTPENCSRHTLNGDDKELKLEIKLEVDESCAQVSNPDEQEEIAREDSQRDKGHFDGRMPRQDMVTQYCEGRENDDGDYPNNSLQDVELIDDTSSLLHKPCNVELQKSKESDNESQRVDEIQGACETDDGYKVQSLRVAAHMEQTRQEPSDKLHSNTDSGQIRVRCEECGKLFTLLNSLVHHLEFSHGYVGLAGPPSQKLPDSEPERNVTAETEMNRNYPSCQINCEGDQSGKALSTLEPAPSQAQAPEAALALAPTPAVSQERHIPGAEKAAASNAAPTRGSESAPSPAQTQAPVSVRQKRQLPSNKSNAGLSTQAVASSASNMAPVKKRKLITVVKKKRVAGLSTQTTAPRTSDVPMKRRKQITVVKRSKTPSSPTPPQTSLPRKQTPSPITPLRSPLSNSIQMSTTDHIDSMTVVPAVDFAKLVDTVNDLKHRVSGLQEEVHCLRGWQERVDKVLIRNKMGPVSGARRYSDIQERMKYSASPGNEEKLCVKEEFRNTLIPFIPDHKEIARRLVNGLFMEAERIGTNVRGIKNGRMDPERMSAIQEAVFILCPAVGESRAAIWQRCVTAINDQNRNIERRMKKILA